MARLIRYLEDGVWKYASVKDVGSLEELLTQNKTDIVSAINELIGTGEAQEGVIVDIQGELALAKQELLKKANVEYVDGQLVYKVDATEFQTKYDAIMADLLEKVDLEAYNLEYDSLVAELTEKANSIDVTTITDGIKEDIANQQIEINNAKTGIADLDAKVNNVQTGLETDISTVQGNLDTAKASLASTQTSLGETQTELDNTKTNLQSTKDELDSVKNNIVYKLEIISSRGIVFKNSQGSTVLEARVYHGSDDITDTLNASLFKWYRASEDVIGDMEWNTSHAGGTKSITVTGADVRVRATFSCEFLQDEAVI
jgi:hypothetical protein